MNDLMSGGIHRAWKYYFIRRINPRHGNRLLDVAGGTGDIAMRYLNYIKYKERKKELMLNEKNEIVVCDVNQAMLDVGKRKAEHLGINKGSIKQSNKLFE
jgi:2-methoxy-6-polyprenyl-1,4-benzoquinol methylase